MDPNKTLETLRSAIQSFRANGDEFNRHWDHEEVLVDAIETLDEWISRGGFLPDAWRPQGRVDELKSRGGF